MPSIKDDRNCAARVSIGMPVYNGARFLREALDSLLAQTFPDFELVISDNASTDDTESIVSEYARRDGRIRYVRQETNQGAAWNFNRVLELARCDYFKWAAADDVCAPTFLAECVELLDRDPSVVCCHTRTRKINEAGEVLDHLDDPTDGGMPGRWFLGPHGPGRKRRDASAVAAHRRFCDVLLSSGWAVRCAGVMRTAALRQTTPMQPYYGSEKVTVAEMALRGRFVDLPEMLFFQRVHEAASSHLATAESQQQFFAARRPARRRSLRWQLLRGHWQAISLAPLAFSQRVLCRVWLVRYLLQASKWSHVVRSICQGRGVGGGAPCAPARPTPAPRLHWTEYAAPCQAPSENLVHL